MSTFFLLVELFLVTNCISFSIPAQHYPDLQSIQGGGSPQLYYHDCSGQIPGHTTRAPPVGFELETNCFQFYAIANLDKTSLIYQVYQSFYSL